MKGERRSRQESPRLVLFSPIDAPLRCQLTTEDPVALAESAAKGRMAAPNMFIEILSWGT